MVPGAIYFLAPLNPVQNVTVSHEVHTIHNFAAPPVKFPRENNSARRRVDAGVFGDLYPKLQSDSSSQLHDR